jgi:hypothetical protein
MAESHIGYAKALSLLYRPRSYILKTSGEQFQVVVDNGRQRGGWLSRGDAHRLLAHPNIKAQPDGLFGSGTAQMFVLRTSSASS